MNSPTTRSGSASALGLAAVVFAAILVLRFAVDRVDDGYSFLYVLPIALVAVQFGCRAGVLAGGVAIVLFGVWASVEAPHLGAAAFAVRCSLFLLTGALTGWLSDRLRGALAHAAAGARHFELARDMLCTATLDGRFIALNGSWEQTLGWSPQELMAQPFVEFVHPDDRARTEAEASRLAVSDPTVSFSNRYRTRSGGWRWLEWSARLDADRGVIYAAARDVTDRRQAEEAQREAEQRFRRAFEDSAVGMAVVGVEADDDNRILDANEALGRILAMPASELIGTTTLARLIDPDDRTAIAEGMQALREGATVVYRAEIEILRHDGRHAWVDLTTSIVRDDAGRPLYRLSQLVDVTARKRSERHLQELAERDPLTGVFNRRRFESELECHLALETPGSNGAVCLLDIDRFKAINDTFGHGAGDAVIVAVGEALVRRLRDRDVVARLGGDEFAILLREVEADEAVMVADSLLRVVGAAIQAAVPGAETSSASIGVAGLDGSIADAPAAVAAADVALYQAKERGRGCAVLAGETSAPHGEAVSPRRGGGAGRSQGGETTA